jgi:hypothetical protein
MVSEVKKVIQMRKVIVLAAMFMSAWVPQWAVAADVGVSINVGQPGFYGQIDIGNVSRPQVLYAQPVWVQRRPVEIEPIYLRVPPGHEKKWSKHCARFNACGRPVYFVRDDWYRNTYVPYYEARGDGDDDHRSGKKDKRNKHGKD